MRKERYIGHPQQCCYVEEHRMVGGKADGMRVLLIANGKGLNMTLGLDRALDILRLSNAGDNYGYLSPCGLVHPHAYQATGNGFLRSFSAGFLTTCGLHTFGTPSKVNGEELPLHGTISHQPCETYSVTETEKSFIITATIREAALFQHQYSVQRTYTISKTKNAFTLKDIIRNEASTIAPLMVLYHINVGFPLLQETSELRLPTQKVLPRNEEAKKGLNQWNVLSAPVANYEEQCFYHTLEKTSVVELFSPRIRKGIRFHYDTESLPYFVQWKMMKEKEYVLGLEPANCYPDGRAEMEKKGLVTTLQPYESKTITLHFTCFKR